MEPRKQAIISALQAFIRQRPGMDPRDYDYKGYRSESREVTKDRKHAETLLAAVSWRDGIDADALIKAAEGAYGGRLTLTDISDHNTVLFEVSYVTGQYFPTEYRKAVCAVLASALWGYTRDTSMPRAEAWGVRKWGDNRIWYAIESTRELVEEDLAKRGGDRFGHIVEVYLVHGKRDTQWLSAGDWLRAHFAREFGRGIASRWFN